MKLKINEMFYTIQGEAEFTGTPALFIRLQGCEVGCAWCDTKHTWEANEETKVNLDLMIEKETDGYEWADMEVTEIIEAVHDLGNEECHVVITGGEPLEQDIDYLVEELVELGHSVQIETSGTEYVTDIVMTHAWVTVSPKINMAGGKHILPQSIERADEIKMPVGKQVDIDNLHKLIAEFNVHDEQTIWLQPLSMNQKSTELCIETAKEMNWRVSMQTHKYSGVR